MAVYNLEISNNGLRSRRYATLEQDPVRGNNCQSVTVYNKNKIIIGIWNIKTLYQCRVLENIKNGNGRAKYQHFRSM